jgi:CheY-like chemotaxis protein
MKRPEDGKMHLTFISNGKHAVLHLLEVEAAPDFVIIDYDLRDISCTALVRILRKNLRFQKTKIIAMSSYFSAYDKKSLTKLGVHGCISIGSDIYPMVEQVKALVV